jgi:LPXTG-motif cell wall-anchored protein
LSSVTKTIGLDNFQYVSYNSLNSNGDPFPIVNRTPFDLPKTGGIGTIIFTAIGLILIAGAAVLLIRTRKTATK